MLPKLYLVIPCYNEEAVLPITAPVFLEQLENMIQRELVSEESRILFINDGSRDGTWETICRLSRENERYKGISLSRNCGHQNALYAGLMYAKERCDVTVSIDCDGQDDVRAMEQMVKKYLDEGCEIVYGVRSTRQTDSFLKKTTAIGFYKLMKRMDAQTIYNHADYRLMSSRALDGLSQFGEVNLYLRGLVPLIGYKSDSVYYERSPRAAGESHYSLRRMLSLAVNGITSLSTVPLTLIGVCGGILSACGVIALLVEAILALSGTFVSSLGWILSSMGLFCGLQLLAIGIVGSYIGKIYLESKARPRYIISEYTDPNG